ncbi:MAG: insulinase family protein, partial [Syntrophales bacterium]|nr:insulinase family protein [Syntrophales bacterium]
CYPVASQNVQDFYNLIDVYLDADFYPRITPEIFKQEGWHFDLQDIGESLKYLGVVYNEMKGAYSSPDNILSEASQQSLFPDITYGFDSGGDPEKIPDLTYEEFKEFHQRYYHPSNSRIFFYGDDDPEKRLQVINEYLKDFKELKVSSFVPLQPEFEQPRKVDRIFATGGEADAKGMMTLNWLFGETRVVDANMALNVLSYILLGTPGSPLRKALIESGLGEDIVGGGLEDELRQMFFSVGMKGVEYKNMSAVEKLIIQTLSDLAEKGIDAEAVEAAINTLEFSLREQNTGSYPRGLVLMLRALTSWLYGGDPLALIAYERPLESLKEKIKSDHSFFEKLIRFYFLDNQHRSSVVLTPDPDLRKRKEEEERKSLEKIKKNLDGKSLEKILQETRTLKKMQETPDTPEALRTIPSLEISDLDRENKTIPCQRIDYAGASILYHDLFTNGIAYIDVGFDIHTIPQEYISYLPLFSRSLLEMGTQKEDYVKIFQRIGRKTGGIHLSPLLSLVKDSDHIVAKLFLRGKGMLHQVQDVLEIIRDLVLEPRFENRERFRQMALEEKARMEQKLIPGGHQVVNLRLRSQFNEADWVAEQMGGISYLFFLRKLVKAIDDEWGSVYEILQEMLRIVVNQKMMLINVTVDREGFDEILPQINRFIDSVPEKNELKKSWQREETIENEGMITPSQVNYVAKGADLYELGYTYNGSINVITRYLRATWLWERIRVQGGAYGAFCSFDRLTGILTFLSYRDPNLILTLKSFDETVHFLEDLKIDKDELTKAIIGAIGDMDAYMLPDAKGYASLARTLAGINDEERQKVRDEVLATTADHFREFAEVLKEVRKRGSIKILGSKSAIEDAVQKENLQLKTFTVL